MLAITAGQFKARWGGHRVYSVVDLFAGAGGLSLGFRNAGFRPVLAVEMQPTFARTYAHNIGPHIIATDIERFARAVLEGSIPLRADVVIGGPPCQGFSNLTGNSPADARRGLWKRFMDVVEASKSRAFVIENVPNLLASQEGAQLIRRARTLGYRIGSESMGVLNAAHFGVPQNRRRAFIVGVRLRGRDLLELPAANPRWKRRTVADAFEGIPATPHHEHLSCSPTAGEKLHLRRTATPLSLQRYRCIPAGGNRFDLPTRLLPECWKRKPSGGTDLFGRLHWDQPARCTIRTEFFKPEKGRYLHPVEDRAITHWEAARLQTFPDSFGFFGTRLEIAAQIGNAVPPLLARRIAEHLYEFLEVSAVEPYKHDYGRTLSRARWLVGSGAADVTA